MNVLLQFKRWEIRLEKVPKSKLVELMLLVFSISLVTGAVVSQSVRLIETRAAQGYQKEIKEMERKRMDARIQTLEDRVRYDTHISK